jgi:hypothetical protein
MRLFKYAGAAMVDENGIIPGTDWLHWTRTGDHAVSDEVPAEHVGVADENGAYPEDTARHLISVGFAQEMV